VGCFFGGGGGVAIPESTEVEEEVWVGRAVAFRKLGSDGFGGYNAMVGFIDKEADRFLSSFFEVGEAGGSLLGFGDAEKDETRDVI